MAGGTYTLLIGLGGPTEITFGAVGPRNLDAGWYAYTGSALGPGGFARVDRHRRVDRGNAGDPHWHVDYLLAHHASGIRTVERSPGIAAECRIAGAIDGDPVPGLGASDCGCDTHLVYSPARVALRASITRAHRAARTDQS